MKNRNPYTTLPAHVYWPALISVYVSFFICKTLLIALIVPTSFFVLEGSAIAIEFFTKGKNQKKALTQLAFLLVVMLPLIILFLTHHY